MRQNNSNCRTLKNFLTPRAQGIAKGAGKNALRPL
jgi:hypothetical protein